MQEQLEALVKFLAKRAGEDDMASAQISSEGRVTLRVGVSYERSMSLAEFVAEINEDN